MGLLFIQKSGIIVSAVAKPLKGFGGAGVLEIVETCEDNSYRAVYTVKFFSAVYVLHAFQEKSKRGIKTPIQEINLIRRRLMDAKTQHEHQRQTKTIH